jgi:adenylate cyclase
LKRAEEALRLHPESSDPAHSGACALAALGERDRAKEWIERALAIDPDDLNSQYNAACVYSLLGEVDRAIDLLEAWAPHVGDDRKQWFKKDLDLNPIRNHPRYATLMAMMG